MNPELLESLLAPSRVAVIGSTSKPGGVGSRVLRHLEQSGYRGDIVVSDPQDPLSTPVDIAVVAVPAKYTQEVIDRVSGFAKHIVVMSSGFEEAGGEKLNLPEGASLIGPNSVGLYQAASRLVLTFAQAFNDLVDCANGAGAFLVSQSGAFGVRLARAANAAGFPLDGFIGTGNETSVTAVDVSRALVQSSRFRPRVIMLYLEAVRDVDSLFALFSEASSAGVPIVMLYGGRTQAGAMAAASHTSALSTDYGVLAEAARSLGVRLVDSDRELLLAARAIAEAGTAAGPRIVIVTGSGGAGVVAADALAERGLIVPKLSAPLQDRITGLLPDFASAENPIDVTAQEVGNTKLVGEVCRLIADSGEADAILAIGRVAFADELQGCAVPVVVGLLDGIGANPRGNGVTMAQDLDGATAALAAISGTVPLSASAKLVPLRPKSREPHRVLTVAESMRLLEDAGVPVAPWAVASTAAEVAAAASKLGFPVVLKTDGDASQHKALAGGVYLDVNEHNINGLIEEIFSRSGSAFIAAQRRASLELFVGIRDDNDFGLLVTVGIGGSHVELVGRTITVPAGVSREYLVRRLHQEVFARGGSRYERLAADLADVAGRMVRLAQVGYQLVESNPIAVVDGKLIALDARVVTHRE